ncbi:mechanosensitive ion channel [Vibrio sp. 1-Bac 57]|uniref:mechanosensitive ion channel family protein n=1 Tax=Psychromonas sp. SA13A TaxID=2686346 RepID=UPI00140B2687|nr:mechanosensitive ion channel domain-containing protein [Psychromonas sp. SA13A]
MTAEEVITMAQTMALEYGPKLIGAIVVWIIGSWLIKILVKTFGKILDKSNMDVSLKPFLCSIVGTLLKVMLVISVLGMLSIEMTSFVAILAAAGLAVGMALSGTLQNFAGGVMLLIFKPFKVGQVIDAQGHVGTVNEIQIFNTILKTPDNKTIILPNAALSSGSMVNFSTEAKRRVDWTVGVAYGDDLDVARAAIKALCDADTRILQDTPVVIAVAELADSSVNFTVRAWVNAADYWGVFFDMNENIYKTFPKQGLNIPFPQMDVHLHKD